MRCIICSLRDHRRWLGPMELWSFLGYALELDEIGALIAGVVRELRIWCH